MKTILLALLLCLVTASATADESPWPRTYESGRLTITMYEPDVTSVSGLVVKGRGAFSVTRSDQSMVFGAVSFTATFAKGTTSDLTLSDFAVEGLRLPDSLMEHQDMADRCYRRWSQTSSSWNRDRRLVLYRPEERSS